MVTAQQPRQQQRQKRKNKSINQQAVTATTSASHSRGSVNIVTTQQAMTAIENRAS